MKSEVNCFGYDPEAVYEALKKDQSTIYINRCFYPNITDIIGTVEAVERDAGGVVRVEWKALKTSPAGLSVELWPSEEVSLDLFGRLNPPHMIVRGLVVHFNDVPAAK